MTNAKRCSIRLFLFLITSVVLANVLHRVVLPPEPADPSTYPRAGDVFASKAEGVTLEVLDVEDGWLVLRARIQPGAPGPPMHYHQTFEEAFRVQSGTLYMELPDGVIQLGPGETALDPICDSTLPEIPAVVRMGIQWLIVPFARVFGYRNYYPELSLHPGT